MTARGWRRLAIACLLAVTVGACGTGWFGGDDAPPLPGERISVTQLDRQLTADPDVANAELRLPTPQTNQFWPQSGGFPSHAMGHLGLGPAPVRFWRSDIGAGSSRDVRLTAQPIVVDGVVYTLDASATVSAFDARTGQQRWRARVAPEEESNVTLGGGVAFAQGLLFVTAGYPEILAIDPANGGQVWRAETRAPTRSAPGAADGRVFVVTLDNELIAVDAETGSELWTHTGLAETAGLLGAAAPAIEGNLVVVAYSSGEVFGLRAETGSEVWSDNLAAVRRPGALANLADISALPVIDRGLVLAISNAGRMVAIDQRTGIRAWQREISGRETPWTAGDLIFLITNDSELTALTRAGGRVLWVNQLDRWEDPEDRDGRITWVGPWFAGGRVLAASSEGEVVEVDPASGQILSRFEISGGAAVAPALALDTMYFVTDDGTLDAFR